MIYEEYVLTELKSRFSYKSDSLDKWVILKDKGAVRGDCEDFALTLAWLLSDRSMTKLYKRFLNKDYQIIWVKIRNGGKHFVLYDSKRKLYADNINPFWFAKVPDNYEKLGTFPGIVTIIFSLIKRF
jgi:hypothetical protein